MLRLRTGQLWTGDLDWPLPMAGTKRGGRKEILYPTRLTRPTIHPASQTRREMDSGLRHDVPTHGREIACLGAPRGVASSLGKTNSSFLNPHGEKPEGGENLAAALAALAASSLLLPLSSRTMRGG